ncbi:hypothetical protein EJ06DRAFT_154699 [Trichodelitschia bisporula]|uniref:U three protein 23 n=1 Tax=Trichodelitschia bisporula TaxID=703511 RepID=A0A6G1HNS0_9PEZI|nr:hypothetical protein EJ06DRAFT_154699 [Trichodelitschia bisporula]
MRGKRAKQYRKLMHQYSLAFGFREPYQVLLDAQILQDADRFKMDLIGGLERTLHGKVKPMITQCSMRHLYTADPKVPALIDQAKRYERRRCNHHTLEKPFSTLECLQSVVDPDGKNTNKHRYVVATQDREVRTRMRQVPGVPLIYINRSVMIMEPMAEATEGVKQQLEHQKFRAGIVPRHNKSTLGKRKHDDEDDSTARVPTQDAPIPAPRPTKKPKKGVKGPNPLSVKKPKRRDAPFDPNPATEDSAAQPTGQATSPKSKTSITQPSDAPQDSATADGKAKRKRKRKPKPDDAAAATTDG